MSLLRLPAILPLAALTGLIAGWLLVQLYNRLPESWLQDYGFLSDAHGWTPARRVHSSIGKVLLMGITAAGFLAAVLSLGLTVQTLLVLLAFSLLLLAAVPDALNKIIPDQASAALALVGAMFAANDLFNGRGIRDIAVDRLGGAVVAGGALLLVGLLATALMKREAMGMGDIKMLFVCGLLTGLRLVPLLYFTTFVCAAAVAVPVMLRQRRVHSGRPAADVHIGIGQSPGDPEDPEGENAAPDERQTPLGPFIAAACFLCLVAGEAVSELIFPYFDLS